jgi:hypothetical protein
MLILLMMLILSLCCRAFFFFILRHKKKANRASTIIIPVPTAAPTPAAFVPLGVGEELEVDSSEGIGASLDPSWEGFGLSPDSVERSGDPSAGIAVALDSEEGFEFVSCSPSRGV